MTLPPVETSAALLERLDAAVAARARLRRRPLGVTVAALAAAARRWQADGHLRDALPAACGLSPGMVAEVLPLAAAALDGADMTALVERTLGPGATERAAPDGPALVAHVLASNVPALALPAIALGCLVGAAVLVKSGRDDALSAPAFQRALAAVDPDLAATVVTTYWRGGDRPREDAVLGRADLVVATGGDAAVAALRARARGRFVAYGPRLSVLAVDASADPEAIARDVALYDQRGCLSPHAVYVTGGDARALAERVARALEALAARLPPGPADVAARAARRLLGAAAEWEPGAVVHTTPGGTVVYDQRSALRPTCGLRTVRVHPLDALDVLPTLLPPATVECVGLAGPASPALLAGLRAAGVARVCPPGRMQHPTLAWPRGQHAPLDVLLGRASAPVLRVET